MLKFITSKLSIKACLKKKTAVIQLNFNHQHLTKTKIYYLYNRLLILFKKQFNFKKRQWPNL